MKIVESHIVYTIYNMAKKKYWQGHENKTFYHHTEKYTDKLILANTFESRAEANQYLKEFITKGLDVFTIKKVKIDLSTT